MVVGGAHGIGRAAATRLSREGASIVVADLDPNAANVVATECRRRGSEAAAVECDLTEHGSVTAAIGTAVRRFGRLDILVNAAGGED